MVAHARAVPWTNGAKAKRGSRHGWRASTILTTHWACAVHRNRGALIARDPPCGLDVQSARAAVGDGARSGRLGRRRRLVLPTARRLAPPRSVRCADFPLPGEDRLARSDYKELCLRMYKALIDEWNPAEADATCEEDCETDCGPGAALATHATHALPWQRSAPSARTAPPAPRRPRAHPPRTARVAR